VREDNDVPQGNDWQRFVLVHEGWGA